MTKILMETGKERPLGNLDTKSGMPCSYKFPHYGSEPDKTPLIPREKWQETDIGVHMPPKYNQGQYGACNAYDTCEILEACRKMAGMDYVRLSPGWLYGHINGQRDSGSMLEDAMAWVTRNGVPPESMIGEYDWHANAWRGKEEKARAEALKYRATEVWRCPTFDHLASAIQCGFFLSLGILWYPNYVPGQGGWLPNGHGRPGGHAIAGYKLVRRGDEWGLGYRQSWGNDGQDTEDGIIPESAFQQEAVGGWWAIRAMVYA